MIRKFAMGAALFGFALHSPVLAKQPAAKDEAALRAIIDRLYTPYMKAPGATPEEYPVAAVDRAEIDQTRSLAALASRWETAMSLVDELYSMNGFDWYCQCQDYDNATARIVRQSYKIVGKDRIDAEILFSPGSYEGRVSGQPLIFRFRREDGAWKLDDLKFHDFTTLRKGLAADISDANKDVAKQKPN